MTVVRNVGRSFLPERTCSAKKHSYGGRAMLEAGSVFGRVCSAVGPFCRKGPAVRKDIRMAEGRCWKWKRIWPCLFRGRSFLPERTCSAKKHSYGRRAMLEAGSVFGRVCSAVGPFCRKGPAVRKDIRMAEGRCWKLEAYLAVSVPPRQGGTTGRKGLAAQKDVRTAEGRTAAGLHLELPRGAVRA